MLENDLNQPTDRHPVINLLLIISVVVVAFGLVGPFIGAAIALPFYPGSFEQLITDMSTAPENHPELKLPIYIIQGCATFIGLIVGPALLMQRTRISVPKLLQSSSVDFMPVLATIIVVITFMGVNSIFIEWNAELKFPEFLKGWEESARALEDSAERMTKFLTQFEGISDLLIALLVIAILPAIGEELVFRGLIQNELFRATKNIHVSIWVAAIVFSAIHMQFFGFVPRLLLGALFGYIYYWSGNLWLSILAHFINNGVSVLALYFYQKGAFDYDLESPEAAPTSFVIISMLLTAGLLYYFYKYFENRKTITH
jgi:uncharacterized protein